MKRTRPTSLRSSGAGASVCLALIAAVLHLTFLCCRASASIFIVAICKDGIVAVADSRFTVFDNDTGRAVAYADGLEKIVHLRAALLAETGQGFIGDERFDLFLKRFEEAAGPLPVELLLPSLLEFGARRLPAEDQRVLEQQHMAVAKFRREQPIICGYDGRLRPCVDRGYVQSSPTDFDHLTARLQAMPAPEAAAEARASMERYIAAQHKSATMGGEFSAAVLTPRGSQNLWLVRNPLPARTLKELIALIGARRIPVTLIPPSTRTDLDTLLESGPAR
jgi:hypothetical protein